MTAEDQQVGIKDEFAEVAKRLLSATPEYGDAKREGQSTAWLDQAATSFADSAFELLERLCEEPVSPPKCERCQGTRKVASGASNQQPWDFRVNAPCPDCATPQKEHA